jgi:SAM-dependent methyltransferase
VSDILDCQWLCSETGQALISQAKQFSDPLTAVTKLRATYPGLDPELIRQAISQSELHKKGELLDVPANFILTSEGLQQGTRPQVAKFRAEFIKNNFGQMHIVDLTCGLGFDSYFLAQAGHKVIGVEKDPAICQLANQNLNSVGVNVVTSKAEDFNIPNETNLIFIDPARRDPKSAKGLLGQAKRIMNPDDWSPSWSFVQQLAMKYKVLAKVAPGMPEELIGDWDAYWISCDGDLVETMLVSGGTGKRVAVLLNVNDNVEIPGGKFTRTSPIGDYLVIPNSAMIRASSLDYLANELEAGLVNEHIAWLTTSNKIAELFNSSTAQVLKINEITKFNEKQLAVIISGYAPGALTVMTRGVTLDPELLRKKILKKPIKGGPEIIVAIYRDDSGPVALICSRLTK